MDRGQTSTNPLLTLIYMHKNSHKIFTMEAKLTKIQDFIIMENKLTKTTVPKMLIQEGNQQNGQKKSWTQDSGKTALVIILAVLAIPVGIPILSAAFALIISILALIFACFIAVFAIGGGLTIGGIAATVAAFTLFPVYGGASSILVAGIGLILLAVGIIIFWLSIVFCVKFFPAAFHVIIKCCRSIGKGLKSFFH